MAHRLFPYSASVLVKWNCIEDKQVGCAVMKIYKPDILQVGILFTLLTGGSLGQNKASGFLWSTRKSPETCA